MKTAEQTADEFIRSAPTPLLREKLVALVVQVRNEALEAAVYAAWGALPVASGVIEEVAQAIRALKTGE